MRSVMTDTVKSTVFLQVQPEYFSYGNHDEASAIRGAKVVGSTQKRSMQPKPGTVEVKITIEIPKGAFLPLRPEAVVVIPQSLTNPHPIQVEALDANETDN
jgi:hypothetical protein